jgi:hypothetical protein
MKPIFLSFFLSFSLSLVAQTNQTDSLLQRINSLELALKEKNYSRVPIGDFDKNLDVRVQTEVYSAFYKYLAVLGLILFGGGFGVYRSIQSELKKQVDDVVKDRNEAIKNQLKDLADTQNRENGRQDVLIKTITDSVSVITSKQESFLSDVSGNVEIKISEATSLIWNDIADNKLRTAKEAAYTGGLLAKELNEFINTDSVKLGMEKKQRLVDALMRCFYITSAAELKNYGYGDKYKEMIKLLKKHEGNIELLPETYVNAAIALNNNYEYYHNEEDKRLSLDCCDKALLKLKDYGIPFILKLELYSMDYKNAYSQQEKDASLDELRRVFHAVNTNQSGNLLLEAIERLQVDKVVPYLKPYLELLQNICHDEMLNLKEKAAKYIISSPNIVKIELYKNLLFGLMNEESVANINMNGVWKAQKSVSAGEEVPTNDLNLEIAIEGYKYTLAEGNKKDLGYIHYLPYTNQHAINLYRVKETGEYEQTVPCISKIEADGSWKLCSNYSSEERPTDFLSTADNKFYLDEFVKQ